MGCSLHVCVMEVHSKPWADKMKKSDHHSYLSKPLALFAQIVSQMT